MSIKSNQLKQKKEEIKRELLKKGIEPNNYEMNQRLEMFFAGQTLGFPYYKPKKQKRYEISDKESYNQMFESLEQDLHVLYQSNAELNNKSISVQQFYENESNRMKSMLQRTKLRIENLQRMMKSDLTGNSFVENFNDYRHIDFYGNTDLNLPYTTAFVDLLQKNVQIEKQFKGVNKLDLEHALIRLSGMNLNSRNEIIGSIENILNDTMDNRYIYKSYDMENRPQTLTIDVDFKQMLTFNTVIFDFLSLQEVKITLSLSEDGITYIPVYAMTTNNRMEWNFKTKEARYLRIVMEKKQADRINGTLYEYDLVLKNITLAKESFENKAIFLSKPIPFQSFSHAIRLDCEEQIFNQTRIEYYIGLEYNQSITWMALKNHAETSLFLFEKRQTIVNNDNPSFGERDIKTGLYKVCDLANGINPNSIRLVPGYQMWQVTKLIPTISMTQDTTIASIDYDSFSHQSMAELDFVDCDLYDGYQIRSNCLYVFTQYVDLKEEKETSLSCNKFFEILYGNDKIHDCHRIFINGVEIVTSTKSRYHFALRKGVNKIQIAVYCPSTEAKTYQLYHNINFKEFTDNVFGCTPMRFLQPAILMQQPDKGYRYYTILEDGLYIKEDPNEVLKRYGTRNKNYANGFYYSRYSVIPELLPFVNSSELILRFMAILVSENPDITPKLLHYQLVGK